LENTNPSWEIMTGFRFPWLGREASNNVYDLNLLHVNCRDSKRESDIAVLPVAFNIITKNRKLCCQTPYPVCIFMTNWAWTSKFIQIVALMTALILRAV
jgi:hypothetical protein